MNDDLIIYMGYQWLSIEDGLITIGVTEDGLEDVEEILAVDLPAENDEVIADEVCGELDSRDGPLNIYSPVTGSIAELNLAIIDTPELVREDPLSEGWLMRIKPENEDDLKQFQSDQNSDED